MEAIEATPERARPSRSTRRCIFAALIAFGLIPCCGGALLLASALWSSFEDGSFLTGLLPPHPPFSGWAAEWAGDLDGDGVDDLLLAIADEPAGRWKRGSVRALSGASGRTFFAIRDIRRSSSWDRMVVAMPDVDGDRRPDLAYADYDRTHLLSGRDGSALRSVVDDWAYSFAAAGDVDGDGACDLLVANPVEGGERTARLGVVRLFSGRDASLLHEAWGIPAEELGWDVTGLGDLDGDGVPEYAATTCFDPMPHILNSARVFSGRTHAVLHELLADSSAERAFVASAGDIDDDGVDDVAVGGGALPSHAIPVRVYSGSTGYLIYELRGAGSNFGERITCAGDVDGDGRSDVAVACWNGFTVFSGSDGEVLRQSSVGCLGVGSGDLDRDGHADMVVAYNVSRSRDEADEGIWREGRLEVLSGRDGSVLLALSCSDLEPLTDR